MDAFDELDPSFRDPNGPAYQTAQARVGPPLEYVAEKLAAALGDLHRAHRAVRGAPGGAGHPESAAELAPPDVQADLRLAFVHALVAYLALGNMLALADDPGALAARLLASSRAEFTDWLWRVGREGSVTG